MLELTNEKKFPEILSLITNATLLNAISAGRPSPSLFPNWNSAEANSFSSFFVLSLILMIFFERNV